MRLDSKDSQELHVVTGAFDFSGKYIAARLLQAGHKVRTLTDTHPEIDPHHGRVEARPLDFDDYPGLVDALRGAAVFYNTYWVRFNYDDDFSFAQALENSRTLLAAAKEAGVGRIVHISITNPSEDSPFELFRNKAILEKLIVESGIPYSILRPAVLFGAEGILINNIAWMLRRFPIFGVFGDGKYKLRPIHVDDLATLALEQGRAEENRIINAVGPETFTFRELVDAIGRAIGKKRPTMSISLKRGIEVIEKVEKISGDILLTQYEIKSLMDNLYYVEGEPTGTTRLSQWLTENGKTLGQHYFSELERRGVK